MPRLLLALASVAALAAPAHAQDASALGRSRNVHEITDTRPSEAELSGEVYRAMREHAFDEASDRLADGLARYPRSPRLRGLRPILRRRRAEHRAIGELLELPRAELVRRRDALDDPLFGSTVVVVTGVLSSVFAIVVGLVAMSDVQYYSSSSAVSDELAVAAGVAGAAGFASLVGGGVWLGVTDHERRRLDLALGRVRF